jgi:hypothetical protein
MAVSTLQNFYKTKIKIATGAGAGNIYVDVKPIPTNGFLVISPGSEALREVIKYTGTGTDGNGDFITIADVADRGLGGTTAQTHAVGEAVRMNYTAEHQKEIDDTIEAIVNAGAPLASTTVIGRVKLATAPADADEPIAVGDNDPRLNATTGLTADKENALAGGGDFGTPSGSNKFVTEGLLENGDIKIIPVSNSGSSTKNINDATGTQVIAHGLGVAPTFVSIKAFRTVSGTTSVSIGEWYAGNGYSTICWHAIEGGSSATADIVTLHTDKVAVLREFANPTVRYQDATITVDATNITINWVKEGAAVSETYDFIWLAKAETLSYS